MLRRIEWPRKRQNRLEPPPCTQGRTGHLKSSLNEGGLEDLLAPRTLTGLQRDSPVLNDVSLATSRRPAEVMVPKLWVSLGVTSSHHDKSCAASTLVLL